LDVGALEGVETGEDTGTGDTTEDVSAGSLHEGHEAFVLQDLDAAVERVLVLDGLSGGHHHSPTDGVDGIGHETGGDGHTPTEDEGEEDVGVVTQQDGLEGVVQTEVHTTVDEDTDARDDESSVQALDTVGLEGLGVDVDETVELALAAALLGALGVVSQSGTSVIQGVDEQERHGAGASTGQDVHAELLGVSGILGGGERLLDLILEGEVQGLRREVPEDVGEITAPEGNETFVGHGALGAVDDAGVGAVKDALLEHLTLILDEELDTLDGSGSGLGHTGGDTGEHEVLEEAQSRLTLLIGHFGFSIWVFAQEIYKANGSSDR